jgi:hypothetical protein
MSLVLPVPCHTASMYHHACCEVVEIRIRPAGQESSWSMRRRCLRETAVVVVMVVSACPQPVAQSPYALAICYAGGEVKFVPDPQSPPHCQKRANLTFDAILPCILYFSICHSSP